MKRLMIIPAAGAGSRLKTKTPKMFVRVNQKALIEHLFSLYADFIEIFVLVVHPSFQASAEAFCSRYAFRIRYVTQQTPTGMLDAILLARSVVAEENPDQVWITWCDQIGVHPRTVHTLRELSEKNVPLLFPTIQRSRPYIHFQRNPAGQILDVLHQREGDVMPPAGESDLGLFCLSRQTYLDLLPAYASEAPLSKGTGEKNFLPFIPWLNNRMEIQTFSANEEMESVGINTPEELAQMEKYLQNRTRVLSVVIPAYNEEKFIGTLLKKISGIDLTKLNLEKEIIVIDDHSTDRTAEIAQSFPFVRLHTLPVNSGKGTAVKTGIALATGNYIIIQDADLEYDPNDYLPMMEKLLSGSTDVVYGSRYLNRGKYKNQSWAAYIGGRSLSMIGWLFTGTFLTDTVTALKLFPAEILKPLKLTTTGFELDHEITSKVLSRGFTINEVPISYFPRTKQEGKKIGFRDWLVALRTFYRFGKWKKRRRA